MWGPLGRLSRRQLVIAAAGSAVGVVVIVILAIVLSNNAPPPATLESAVESVRQEAEQPAGQAAGAQEAEQQAAQAEESSQPSDESEADQGSEATSASAEQQAEAQPAVEARGNQEAQEDDSAASGYGDDYGSAGDDPQDQADAGEAADSEAEESAQTEEQQAQPQQQAAAVASPASLSDLAGTWTLSERGESFVGYRIGEELANIGTATAVGRTGDITATLEFDGTAITSVVIVADLRTLKSDQSFRDSALKTRGLESDTYPFATFNLTESISIADLPSADEAVRIDCVRGTLELHGVTNDVCIVLEGQLVDGQLVVVVGSTEIALADYEIEPPTGFRVLSIEEVGLMEFQIVFERGE